MDQELASVMALAASFLALLVAAATGYRQLRLMRGANLLPVVLEGFRETRTKQWSDCRTYILDHLRDEHDPSLGIWKLPEPVKHHFRYAASFYDDLGKLVAHKVVDERLILGAYGGSVVPMWRIMAPLVVEERAAGRRHMYVYFEDLAARALRRSEQEIHKSIHLQQFPQTP